MRWSPLVIVLAAVALAPSSASANFEKCSISSVKYGRLGTSPSGRPVVYVRLKVTATIRFSCPGTSGTPTLESLPLPGIAAPTVGPAVRDGELWTFDVTHAVGATAYSDGNLRFTEPGGSATQLFGLYPEPDNNTPSRPANDCTQVGVNATRQGNVTYQFPVSAKRPGESDFSPVPLAAMCASATVIADAGRRVEFHIWPGPETDFEWYEEGTTYRFTAEIPGINPFAASGRVEGLKIEPDGTRFTLEGRPVKQTYKFDGTSCSQGSLKPEFFGEVNTLEATPLEPSGLALYKGMTIGYNGNTASPPNPQVVADNGGFTFRFDGCGDADPSTKEGWYETFIPPGMLDFVKIDQGRLAAASGDALANLFDVSTNGEKTSDLAVSKERYPDGRAAVRLVARTSFSSSFGGATRARSAAAEQLATQEVTIRRSPSIPSATLGKPNVKWKASRKKRTITAGVRLTVGSGITHSISAKKAGSKKNKRGRCRTNASKSQDTCTLKLGKGRWQVSVTPRQGAVTGPASSKNFRF